MRMTAETPKHGGLTTKSLWTEDIFSVLVASFDISPLSVVELTVLAGANSQFHAMQWPRCSMLWRTGCMLKSEETIYSASMLLYVSAVSLAHFMRLILVVNFVLHGFPSQQLSFCTSPSSRFEPWQSRGFMSNAISVLTQHMFQSSQSLLLSLGLRIPPLLIIGY